MGRIHNPPHPGESMREDILPALGLSVSDVTLAALEDLGLDTVWDDPNDPTDAAGQRQALFA